MSMSIWRSRKPQDIVAGEAYSRTHPDFVETARVLAVCQDPVGIPHVRYMVSYARRTKTVLEDGPRILSLAAFTSHYSEPVQA